MSNNFTVVANWKMNTTLADAMILTESTKDILENISQVDIILAPPAIWLYPMAETLSVHPIKNLKLAAQNISQYENGPHTGEISAKMVKSIANYTLIGHSERVEFGETEKITNQKIKEALKVGLKPIILVSEIERGNSKEIIDRLSIILDGIAKNHYSEIIFTFEPVWAISTNKKGEPASLEEIESAVSKMRQFIGKDSKIFYGGSVNINNIGELTKARILDGVLIGSASLKTKEFMQIIKLAYTKL
jgi:triosephosphate isomerase